MTTKLEQDLRDGLHERSNGAKPSEITTTRVTQGAKRRRSLHRRTGLLATALVVGALMATGLVAVSANNSDQPSDTSVAGVSDSQPAPEEGAPVVDPVLGTAAAVQLESVVSTAVVAESAGQVSELSRATEPTEQDYGKDSKTLNVRLQDAKGTRVAVNHGTIPVSRDPEQMLPFSKPYESGAIGKGFKAVMREQGNNTEILLVTTDAPYMFVDIWVEGPVRVEPDMLAAIAQDIVTRSPLRNS